MKRMLTIVAVTLSMIAVAQPAYAEDLKFVATLTGAHEVPPVPTPADGKAEFEYEGESVKFELEWEDLTTPARAAHIHCAPPRVNGLVGVTLLSTVTTTEGKVVGTFTAPDAGNGCGWQDLDDVITALLSGDTYVNVHTSQFPRGEIRGQIREA